MLNYFHEHQAIPEVFVICSQLDTLKHRIMSGNYENPRKEFDECKDLFDAVKQKAIGSNNEQLANAQLIYKHYFQLFCDLSAYFRLGFIHLTALIQKMSQPVIVLPVPGNGIPDYLGLINVVVLVDHTFGTFNDPGQNRTACLVIEVVSIVLDVRFFGDFSIERDNDQPTPGASIHGTDFG